VPTATQIAYGNIAEINPFRYRSYYFDEETSLYYLQSRYYDANVGRFVNADDIEILYSFGRAKECNLFAYCNGDPTQSIDPFGHFSIPSWTIAMAIDAIILGLAGWLKATWMGFMAPLKAMGKKAAARYFAKYIAWKVTGITNSLINIGVKALIWIGKTAYAAAFNFSAKMAIAAIINEPLRIVTACMSIGGLFAAIWDYFSDKSFNGWIKLW
jgi:RHS repeat-associated protein